MKICSPLFFLSIVSGFLILIPHNSFSQSKSLIDATGVYVEKTVDAMTDEEACHVRLDDQGVDFLILAHNRVAFSHAGSDGNSFSFQDQNLIRVGNNDPYELRVADPPDILTLQGEEATEVIKALNEGQDVLLRYYNWPYREQRTMELSYPAIGYGYNKAVSECGWEDIGLSSDPTPPEMNVSEGRNSRSYRYRGTSGLSMSARNIDSEPTCIFSFNGRRLIEYRDEGFYDARGVTSMEERIRVLSSEEKEVYAIVFEGRPPLEDKSVNSLVKAILAHLPLGKVAYETRSGRVEETSLLGFRELYKEGMDTCGLPAIEDVLAD